MPKAKTWRTPLLKNDQKHGNGETGKRAGSLLHYEDDWDAKNYVNGRYVNNVEWVPAEYRIQGRLVMDDGIHSGRSAKYVSWTDEHGRNYPMFVAELVKLIKTGDVQKGGVIEGDFKVVKRGKNYGIEYVGPTCYHEGNWDETENNYRCEDCGGLVLDL